VHKLVFGYKTITIGCIGLQKSKEFTRGGKNNKGLAWCAETSLMWRETSPDAGKSAGIAAGIQELDRKKCGVRECSGGLIIGNLMAQSFLV
jgi:hypothetical protein